MKYPCRTQSLTALRAMLRGLVGASASLAMVMPARFAQAQAIDAANWGSVTAPVFGTSQIGTYAGAELFTGPNQFGSYYAGVLPNGRKVTPAGISAQIGMNPLGSVLTPDGKYLITSNDDEREGGLSSLQSTVNKGSYSLSVIDTATLNVVSQISSAGPVFIGLQVKGSGPYTVYASGGPSQNVKTFSITGAGAISPGPSITIAPITPKNAGFVSNYTVAPGTNAASGNAKPNGYSTGGAKITFPAGSALSPDGRYLYVACNGDNSLAVIDTNTNTVVKQIAVGYFPYGVSVSRDGSKVFVANWGMTPYKFANPTYDGSGNLTAVTSIGNLPAGFFVPSTSTTGVNPQTSSVSIVSVPGGNPLNATTLGAIYEGQPGGIDALNLVGDTHPSASAIVRRGAAEVLYVCKANNDSIGLIVVNNNRKLADFDLSPVNVTLGDGHKVHGAYPNAIVVSPDNTRAYVAEAGINSVAVLDTTNPTAPKLLGRIPTGWYPTALSLSADGRTLFVMNAKGIGEDINPNTDFSAATGNPTATGVESFADGNYIFGSVQKISLSNLVLDNTTVLGNNYAINPVADTSIVPRGGAASTKIKHVFFILRENKTFDSVLGDQSGHFGNYASLNYNSPTGGKVTNSQFTPVSPNLRLLATTFAAGVNYYSDSEESDAGHQFCASGTATDYTEKTLLVKGGRGLLVNKNFEPEDYPEGGYIYNNAARNGVNFRLYGLEAARLLGSDTGGTSPASVNDPQSGNAGYPQLPLTNPVTNVPGNPGKPDSDVTSPTGPGVGQSFFMNLPGLGVLGTPNPNGLGRLDTNYPGYNFNISDQRRAREFCKDFDNMVTSGTLPEFLYIYLPNNHTGGPFVATNVAAPTAAQQVADGDVALGMVVQHIMASTAYYNSTDGTGSAIIATEDDAQSTLDHIHEHRTPVMVISPYAKVDPANTTGAINQGYVGKKHYSSASIVKTEELLLGLPPNNLGDLFATDLRDLFQSTYNGITEASLHSGFNAICKYTPTAEGRRIWALVNKLDTSAPDKDSHRLGALARLSMKADDLHKAAIKKNHLNAKQYKDTQASLYAIACKMVSGPAPRDSDD